MFCSGCDRTALSDWYIGQMHRFHPSRPQHGLHLGSTLANKAPTSAQLGPTYLQLRPNLAPNMRNLAPSWARLGATSAQVEVHMASKWGTWPSCVLSCATFGRGLSLHAHHISSIVGSSGSIYWPLQVGPSWAPGIRARPCCPRWAGLGPNYPPTQDQVVLSTCVQTCPTGPSSAQVRQ